MARFAKGASVELPQYRVLMQELQKITKDKKLIARRMASAVRYAAKPSHEALLANVSRVGEKTGNLKRAVYLKVKSYSKSGNAAALVGYIRAGSDSEKNKGKGRDKAYHQGFLEFGTKERFVKGPIASSFRKGAFMIFTIGKSLQTGNYPKTFFKRGKKDQPLSTGKMRVGGISGKPPIKNAFETTKSQINTRLVERTKKVIDSLMKAVKKAESK
jgi:hypothetical protein